MPDLEDSEGGIVEQERWGMSRVALALRAVVREVRLIRARVATHEQRLDALKARLDQLDPPV